jgi:hypothetical protein
VEDGAEEVGSPDALASERKESGRHTTPPVFFVKSAEAVEKKRVEFLGSAKERKRVRKNVKRRNLNNAASPIADTAGAVPKWEEYPHTPGVFVRARNKGDKSSQRTGMVV